MNDILTKHFGTLYWRTCMLLMVYCIQSSQHMDDSHKQQSGFLGYWKYVSLLQEKDAFFVMTNLIITPQQTKGRCGEVRDYVTWFLDIFISQ